jgi:AcrR family transcriptional regulator
MPQRSETEARLLDAAVRLFAVQGFNATSTREISRLAHVSETSLFRHFTTKNELFWAALKTCMRGVRVSKALKASLARDDRPELVLALIVEFLVDTASYHPEFVRLLYFGVLELRTGVEPICRTQLGPIFLSLCKYLDRCIADGELLQVDSSIAASSFILSILMHQPLHGLLTGAGPAYSNPSEAVAAYSRFWLKTLTPKVD